MEEKAISFLKELESLGYVGYIVGGYPRDKYLGYITTDIDICTNMKPDILEKHFSVVSSFKEYGSMKIEYQGCIFEVTTFRKEGNYSDYRRPDEVIFIDSLEEDLKRRDFTINTLCINSNGEYVDKMNARKDLDQKIIKVVGNTEYKLTEDPLRMLRALRFSVNLKLELDPFMIDVIKKKKDFFSHISEYRKKEEIEKINNMDQFHKLCIYLEIEDLIKI